jgi:hypothetical protein
MADDTTYPHMLAAAGFQDPAAPPPAPAQPAQPSNYDGYATGGGFAGAQGASQIEATKRKLASAKQQLALQGQDERLNINNTMEDRGFFNSGQRLQSLAKQQGSEASKAADLEASAAGDIANINANVHQAITQSQLDAEKRAQDAQVLGMQKDAYAGQQAIQLEQIKAQRDQLQLQKQLAQQKLDLQKATAAGNYGDPLQQAVNYVPRLI